MLYLPREEASILASILVATTPVWIGLLEMFWPRGDRLTFLGWAGVVAGLGGVVILLGPRLHDSGAILHNFGSLLVLGSAFAWSLGSLLIRHHKPAGSPLVHTAYQMVLGGFGMTAIGLVAGEGGRVTAGAFTPAAVYAFFHLLVVGSLVGFLAYAWLLRHVSAALAGTYAYVNPLVAILVGWLIGGEQPSARLFAGMAVILAGVALVRGGEVHSPQGPGHATPPPEHEPAPPAVASGSPLNDR